jgi:hypothetical protein
MNIAGWSSPVARQAHNLKVVGSNPTPATTFEGPDTRPGLCFQGFQNITRFCPSGFYLPKSSALPLVLFTVCSQSAIEKDWYFRRQK